MAKNSAIGIKFAKQMTKGAPKDGCFRDVTPRKETMQSPNPSKAKGLIIPQK